MSAIVQSIRSIYRLPPTKLLFVLEWTIASLIAVAAIAPRGALAYLALMAAALLLHRAILAWTAPASAARGSSRPGNIDRIPDTAGAVVAWIGLAAFLAYATVTSYLVEPDVAKWFRKPLQAGLVVVLCWVICRVVARFDETTRWHVARGILHGFLLGLVYIGIEHLTAGGIKAAATNLTGLFPLSAKANIVEAGQVVEIGTVFLNRHSVAIVVLVWAAVLAGMVWLGQHRWMRRACVFGVVGAVVVLAFLSVSETAKLAIVVSIVVALAVQFARRLSYRLVQIGWVVLVLGIIPLIIMLFPVNSQLVEAMPFSAKDRVVIWHYTIKRIDTVPILGHGAASTRLLSAQAEKPKGRALVPRLSRHAHNVYLQTWFELGALGAVLLLVIGLGVLASIASAYVATQPFLMAQFVAIASVALTGYGMWQVWLLSLVALSACLMSCLAHPSSTVFASRPRE